MYIKKVEINNIRSISHFEMEFPAPAGWHVLIGDNGTGKSSIVRSIALGLIPKSEVQALLPVWNDWLRRNTESGKIDMITKFHAGVDVLRVDTNSGSYNMEDFLHYDPVIRVNIEKKTKEGILFDSKSKGVVDDFWESVVYVYEYPVDEWEAGLYYSGWFSAGFGPFRRFTGGDEKRKKVYESAPTAGAHLSIFGEEVALSEALDWLQELDNKRLREKEQNGNSPSGKILQSIKKFINESKLLPHAAQFSGFNIDGELIFKDGAGNEIPVVEMSDGYRSILSLTFELIRQLIRCYKAELVFKNIDEGEMIFDLPGVVLIDEIDAHLHPSWQTKIGHWFTKYFPKLQFIVTTHSPLICRACDKGSIWRLAAPGTDEQHQEITGIEKERLVYGNILDAYGTELFGPEAARSERTDEKKDRLGKLNILAALGKINKEEEKERISLQKILTTDDPTGYKKN